jgi:hypothetical protein
VPPRRPLGQFGTGPFAKLRACPLWLLLLLAAWLAAGLPAAAGTFVLSTRTTEIPERGEVTSTVLRVPQLEFTFLSPAGWRCEVDAGKGTLTWTSPDYASVLRLQVRFQGGGRPDQLRSEELRQVVLQELPAARITEEFACPSGAGAGLAFDAERVVHEEFPVSSRMAFVPFPGGRAEILASAPRDQFSQAQVELTGFLNSFRFEAGKGD